MEKGQFIQAAGINTHYFDEGSGSTVILLHGSGPGVSAETNWGGLLPEFAKGARVVAPDMAGFGYTERNAELGYNIKLWIEHLIAFMDALDIGKASLVGNSFGGSLALAASAKHADRFDRLVLMGTPCDKFEMTDGLRAGWDYVPGQDAMRSVMSHFPYDPSVITDELVEIRYNASLISGAQEGLRKLLVKPNEDGPTPLSGMPISVVSGINHPTLVMHGREDKVIPVELGIRLATAMPDCEFHMFGECGHWVQVERRAAFLELAIGHLAGRS